MYVFMHVERPWMGDDEWVGLLARLPPGRELPSLLFALCYGPEIDHHDWYCKTWTPASFLSPRLIRPARCTTTILKHMRDLVVVYQG